VDEIAWCKGHHYLSMVYQIDEGRKRLLWIGQERIIKTLLRFFHFFGPQRSQELRYFCSDMWRPYIKVIEKKAGHALHILDRFHIVARLNKAIDEVRAGEHRQL
jgi:transposase